MSLHSCKECRRYFDPNEEGIVGHVDAHGSSGAFCDECYGTIVDADNGHIDETLTNDMADRMANGATFLEA